MQAKDLKIGQRFESVNCKATIRDLICLRISYTAVFVLCEQRADLHSPWKRTREYIACESEVEPKDEILAIGRDSQGQITVNEDVFELPEGESAITPAGKLKKGLRARYPESYEKHLEKKEKKVKENKPAGKRGRKAVSITFPKGKFTIPEAAKANGVSVTAVYLKLLELQKDKKAKIVDERPAARGRPTKVWKIL